MLNRYLILGIFMFFLILFGVLIFWDGQEQGPEAGEKEIVWLEKPSFMLLKEIKSQNPVLRREAIIKLGEKRVKTAIEPLFEIMFSDYPLYEKQLSAKSVAMISGEEMVPLCVRILENYDENSAKDVVLSMLYILKSLDLTGKDLSRYDFSILVKLLNSPNNDVILNAIESIENLKYIKAFNDLTQIYSKNFFFKVSVLKALTQLALQEEKLSGWLSSFLAKTLWEESHDSVRQTIRESLFSLSFKRKPNQREGTLIGLISDLNSSSFKKALEAQNQLFNSGYEEKDLDLFTFFLNDRDPVVVNRLIPFVEKNKIQELKPALLALIKNRYAGSGPEREIYQDSAKKAVSALAALTTDPQDVNLILSLVQDSILGQESLEACETFLKRKIDSDSIEKKVSAMIFYNLSAAQKSFLYPLLRIALAQKQDQKVLKMMESGETYIRYNTLNLFLRNRPGTLPDEVKNFQNSQDLVIQSLLNRYRS